MKFKTLAALIKKAPGDLLKPEAVPLIKKAPGELLKPEAVKFIAGLDESELENLKAIMRQARAPTRKLDEKLAEIRAEKEQEAAKKEAARAVAALSDDDFDSRVAALKAIGIHDRPRLASDGVRKALAALYLDHKDVAESVLSYWRAHKVADPRALEVQIKKDADALRAARLRANRPEDGRVVIVNPVNIPELFGEITDAIKSAMPEVLFQRNGELVRLRVLKEKTIVEGAVFHPGYCDIAPADEDWLGYAMQKRGVKFMDVYLEECAPPFTLLRRYLRVSDAHKMDYLRSLSALPTIGRNEPGYDPETEMFLAFPHGSFPDIPMKPTKREAVEAFKRVAAPLREYSFLDDASRAVGISVLMSAVLRASMRTCPMHAITGQGPGVGKTKFGMMADGLQRGENGIIVGLPRNDDEMEKRLATMLMWSSPNITFDNVTRHISDESLCLMLTCNPWTTRKLGGNERATLDTTCLVTCTGNKIAIEGDMRRRSVVCTLTTGGFVNIEDRQHSFDPVEEVLRDRYSIIRDCLIVARAWIAAGRPLPAGYKPMNSFADYTLVRGPLLWLGEADPIETNKELYESDAEADERAGKVKALFDHFGEGAFFARDLEGTELAAMLGGGYVLDARELGYALRDLSDAAAGDLVLMQAGKREKTNLWQVRKALGNGRNPAGAES